MDKGLTPDQRAHPENTEEEAESQQQTALTDTTESLVTEQSSEQSQADVKAASVSEEACKAPVGERTGQPAGDEMPEQAVTSERKMVWYTGFKLS